MNGELAQAIGLALHGSAWLADPSGPPPDLGDGPTFGYVRLVRFAELPAPGTDDRMAATSSAEWFGRLRELGAERILFVAPPAEPRLVGGEPVDDHMLAAFAGGGRWALVTVGPGGLLAWPAHWEVGDQQAPDHRIWDVTYLAEPAEAAVLPIAPSIDVATAELAASLSEVEAFARTNGVEGWADAFRDALDVLRAEDPPMPYYEDVLPLAMSPDRRRLAAAAGASWVFGGMGSWNDLGFERPEPQATYDRITARLYRAALDAFVAVVDAL